MDVMVQNEVRRRMRLELRVGCIRHSHFIPLYKPRVLRAGRVKENKWQGWDTILAGIMYGSYSSFGLGSLITPKTRVLDALLPPILRSRAAYSGESCMPRLLPPFPQSQHPQSQSRDPLYKRCGLVEPPIGRE